MNAPKELDRLLHAYLEGVLGDADALRLNERLSGDPNAVRRLAEFALDQSILEDLAATRVSEKKHGSTTRQRPIAAMRPVSGRRARHARRTRTASIPWLPITLAAAVALVVLLALISGRSDGNGSVVTPSNPQQKNESQPIAEQERERLVESIRRAELERESAAKRLEDLQRLTEQITAEPTKLPNEEQLRREEALAMLEAQRQAAEMELQAAQQRRKDAEKAMASTTQAPPQPKEASPVAPKTPMPPDVASSTKQPPKQPPMVEAKPVFELIATDEFASPQLAELQKKWGIYDGTPGTDGVGRRSKSAIRVENGILTIAGKGDVVGGMAQRLDQLYGKWEIRARVDEGTGYGPALLLWPKSGKWPDDGEIDLMECHTGERNKVSSTIHHGTRGAHKQTGRTLSLNASEWHTYTCEWTPDGVRLLADDTVVLETREPAAIPGKPMHLAIQLDIGGAGRAIPAPNATTPPEVRLQVEWVKVYKLIATERK